MLHRMMIYLDESNLVLRTFSLRVNAKGPGNDVDQRGHFMMLIMTSLNVTSVHIRAELL